MALGKTILTVLILLVATPASAWKDPPARFELTAPVIRHLRDHDARGATIMAQHCPPENIYCLARVVWYDFEGNVVGFGDFEMDHHGTLYRLLRFLDADERILMPWREPGLIHVQERG